MSESTICAVKGLHLAIENGKPVLKNTVNDVEVTISFAEEEPPRNAKEACLSIISSLWCDSLIHPETNM